MANIQSAKKRSRQIEKRSIVNVARRSAVKTAVKKLLTAIDAHESSDTLTTLFKNAQAQIARARGKGLLHDNTAARKISRLAVKVKAASAAAR